MSQNRFRKPKTFFTQVSNHAIDDDRLSPQAYYIYSKIQRYITIEDFVLNKELLFNKCNMSEKTFDKYWKELQHLGYLKIYQIPLLKDYNENPVDGKTKFTWLTEYDLLEKADTDSAYYTQFNMKGDITKIYTCKPPVNTNTPKAKKYVKSSKTVREIVSEVKEVCDTPNLGGTQNEPLAKVPPHNNTGFNKTNLTNTLIKPSLSNVQEVREESPIHEHITLIQEHTGLTLSAPQQKMVAKWDKAKLDRAIDLFVAHSGSSFAYLKSCYTNPINVPTTNKRGSKGQISSKNTYFTNTYEHDFDIDELERKERELINQKYNGNSKASDPVEATQQPAPTVCTTSAVIVKVEDYSADEVHSSPIRDIDELTDIDNVF